MSEIPILSPKMRTAGKDFIGSNCEMFFPCDEGSGDTLTDIVKGYQMTKVGAVYSVPHAVKNSWNNSNRSDSLVLSKPTDTHIIMFLAGTVDLAFTSFAYVVGSSSIFNVFINDTTAGISSPAAATVNANFDTVAGTDEVLLATTLNKDTGELRSYNGINGAVVNFATANIGTHLGNMDALNNAMGFSGVANSHKAMGLLFPKTLPTESDLIDMLEVTRKNIINGRKWFDPRLSNY